MNSIYKYPLSVIDSQVVKLPRGASILCVQVQHDTPQLWALVDVDESHHDERTIRIADTGHPLASPTGHYLGTFQLHDGSFVGHVFEVAA